MNGTGFLVVNGTLVSIDAGATVAAVLLNHGVEAFRASVAGERRGPLCAMGICHECRVTVDGIAHRRACLVAARDGMVVITQVSDGGRRVPAPELRAEG